MTKLKLIQKRRNGKKRQKKSLKCSRLSQLSSRLLLFNIVARRGFGVSNVSSMCGMFCAQSTVNRLFIVLELQALMVNSSLFCDSCCTVVA